MPNENTQERDNERAANLASRSWTTIDWSHQPWNVRAEVTVESFAPTSDELGNLPPDLLPFAKSVLFDIYRL